LNSIFAFSAATRCSPEAEKYIVRLNRQKDAEDTLGGILVIILIILIIGGIVVLFDKLSLLKFLIQWSSMTNKQIGMNKLHISKRIHAIG